MEKLTFELNESSEFIQLDKLLKILSLVNSGGEAHLIISKGLVQLNGNIETRKRKKIHSGDIVIFENNQIEVIK